MLLFKFTSFFTERIEKINEILTDLEILYIKKAHHFLCIHIVTHSYKGISAIIRKRMKTSRFLM